MKKILFVIVVALCVWILKLLPPIPDKEASLPHIIAIVTLILSAAGFIFYSLLDKES